MDNHPYFDDNAKGVFLEMSDGNGEMFAVTLSGKRVFYPNTATASGYGSDHWLFLCQFNDKKGILDFEANGECGDTWWILYEITDSNYDKLTKRIVTSTAWQKALKNHLDCIRFISPSSIKQVKSLLPDSSRLFSFTDKQYFGFQKKND